MTDSIGTGPNSSGLIVLGDQLQIIKSDNRADFDVISQVGESSSLPSWMQDGVQALSGILPIAPTISIFRQVQDGRQDEFYSAIGLKGEISASGRLRALLNLAGVSSAWSRGISRFLPELSAGLSVGWNDNQTLMAGTLEIGLPLWLDQHLRGCLENRLKGLR